MPVTHLDILAPLSGVLVDLASVPDPVFAQKLAGDGVSLDPTSAELLAPIAGVVTQLHPSKHAVAITSNGLELLLHVGIDTVMLKGEGFTAKVAKGDTVQAGQPLLVFDADLVAQKALSLLTQIVITNGERVKSMTPGSGLVRAGKDVALRVELAEPAVQVEMAGGEALFSEPVKLPNPAGLHARPAAVLASEAKRYSADLRLLRGAEEANAKSVVSIMGLSLKSGEMVRVKATGADASLAVAALAKLLTEGCGEKPGAAPSPPSAPSTSETPGAKAVPKDANEYAGAPASPGLAVGRVLQFRQKTIDVRECGEGPDVELHKLEDALREARQQVDDLRKAPDASKHAAKGQILDAHHELLDDPELTGLAMAGLGDGKSAAFAWREAFTKYAAQLEGLDNALLRERANDIRDVGRRVLTLLAGVSQAPLVTGNDAILIADELSPSDTATLDRGKVLGFCSATGGTTSHVAILARSLGIPAICGIDQSALELEDGTPVVLDGDKGLLRRNPSEAELEAARARMVLLAERREQELAAAGVEARTKDGHRIEVSANVRNAKDAQEAAAKGAEGVGLVRSEFLFDERDTAPNEEEQAKEYAGVAQAMGVERRVVIRTLDVGGDKPLSYLPLPREDNPFLGIRGVRVSLERPELFRAQLRAILRAAPFCDLHVMFPMIATLEELREAKRYLAEEQEKLRASGVDVAVKVGVMIEVPSAAVLADAFALEADFFSIGSNDLTQYTLAMDRGHPKLAKQADALHPAVLRLIGMACEAAQRHGKWVGVCGGMASDVLAAPALLGLGVTELSCSIPAIPAVKAAVARLSLAECQVLAKELVNLGTAGEVRARLAALNQ
jgi:phosphocarrier protein FPr/phosphocarrier protein